MSSGPRNPPASRNSCLNLFLLHGRVSLPPIDRRELGLVKLVVAAHQDDQAASLVLPRLGVDIFVAM